MRETMEHTRPLIRVYFRNTGPLRPTPETTLWTRQRKKT
jgi:hypothetical protein